jgi:hypothetical protein
MVTFTDSQVDEMLTRLIRIQENAIAIDEERLYWKGIAEVAATQADELEKQVRNLTHSCDELRRMYHQSQQARQEEAVFARGFIDRSMETIDEKNREIAALKEIGHQNAVAADGFAREVAMLREQNRIQSNTNSCYSWLLHNLDKMRQDYAAHRGRFGGTGVAEELVNLMNGELYVTSSDQDGILEAECDCGEPKDDWWQDEPFSYNDLPDHDY